MIGPDYTQPRRNPIGEIMTEHGALRKFLVVPGPATFLQALLIHHAATREAARSYAKD